MHNLGNDTLITKIFGGKKFGEKTSAKKFSVRFFDISVKYFGQIVNSTNHSFFRFYKINGDLDTFKYEISGRNEKVNN